MQFPSGQSAEWKKEIWKPAQPGKDFNHQLVRIATLANKAPKPKSFTLRLYVNQSVVPKNITQYVMATSLFLHIWTAISKNSNLFKVAWHLARCVMLDQNLSKFDQNFTHVSALK